MAKYFLCWFPMLIIAVLNGTVRDLGYKKYTGELLGHQISTISLILLFGFYVWVIMQRFPPKSGRDAILIGLMWLMLTLIFEWSFGLAQGNSCQKILSDYNIFKGRVWILVLIWTTAAPYLFFKQTQNVSK